MDEFLRHIVDEAISISDAADQFCARRCEVDYVQRSSDSALVFKVHEDAKVEAQPLPPTPEPQPEPETFSEEQREVLAHVIADLRREVQPVIDDLKKRIDDKQKQIDELRAELLKREIEGLHAELKTARDFAELKEEMRSWRAKNVTPMWNGRNAS